MLTYGSLFTGAGGLEMGIQSVLPGRTLWHSDIDPGACKVIEHRCPWTLGQLLAMHALVKVAGHERLAALILDHSSQHEPDEHAEGDPQ